jgi:hypothetical protein
MAGDWIKIENELPDKPEVHAIAAKLNIDPDAVVGKLIRVWQWFDKHTVDGNALGVSFALVDRITGVIGFGEAMMFSAWLEQKDKMLVMPHFDRHTSSSAKKRALTAKRVANFEQKTNAKANATTNAANVSGALPREEKNISITNVIDKGANRAKKLPDDFLPNEWHIVYALQNKLNLEEQFAQFADYHKARGSTMKDWNAALRTWLRNATQYRKTSPSDKPGKPNYFDHLQDVSNQLTGRTTNAGITLDMDQRIISKI